MHSAASRLLWFTIATIEGICCRYFLIFWYFLNQDHYAITGQQTMQSSISKPELAFHRWWQARPLRVRQVALYHRKDCKEPHWRHISLSMDSCDLESRWGGVFFLLWSFVIFVIFCHQFNCAEHHSGSTWTIKILMVILECQKTFIFFSWRCWNLWNSDWCPIWALSLLPIRLNSNLVVSYSSSIGKSSWTIQDLPQTHEKYVCNER